MTQITRTASEGLFSPWPVSAFILLLVNLVPLWGVLYGGWGVFDVMVLFWAENIVIGLLNIVKMAMMIPLRKAYGMTALIPFFTLHYGLFTLVHGIFVFTMFHPGSGIDGSLDSALPHLTGALMSNLWIPILLLFVSHGLSVILNFILRQEYQRIEPNHLMVQPYGRVVILHMTILLGGFLVMATGQAISAIIFLVGLKTVIDLIAHNLQHRPPKEKEESA